MSDLFVIVDMQNDFISGSLAVPDAESILGPIVDFGLAVERVGGDVIFTRDWHPASHTSFEVNGGIWPAHCVQDTWGAEIEQSLTDYFRFSDIFSKGMDPKVEQYSAFNAVSESFEGTLSGVAERYDRIWIGGLALDYCVDQTMFDLFGAGHDVTLLLDCTRPVAFETGARTLLNVGHYDQSGSFSAFDTIDAIMRLDDD